MKTIFLLVPLAGLSFLGFAGGLHAQGGLTPAGTPGPTMKSLAELEPRTNIQRTIDPLPTDANYHYIISAPGSYYLTENLGVTKTNGIRVTAPDVTIDLNGFRISRASGTGGDGITIDSAAARTTVRDGAISGFANGVQCVSPLPKGGSFIGLVVSGCSATGLVAGDVWEVDRCVASSNATGIKTGVACTLSAATAFANTSRGIDTGESASLTDCTARENAGDYAFFIRSGSTLVNCRAIANTSTVEESAGFLVSNGGTMLNCTARDNRATYGIYGGNGNTLANCTAHGNNGAGSVSAGIFIGQQSTITNSVAHFNGNTSATGTSETGQGIRAGTGSSVIGCTAATNRGTGIGLGTGATARDCISSGNGNGNPNGSGITGGLRATIINCTAHQNQRDGIQVDSDVVVSGCHASANGFSGIALGGTGNRIEGNTVRNNIAGNGIYVTLLNVGNSIIRNTAGGNGGAGGNYLNVAGNNDYGPIGTPATATSPSANFQ